MTLARFVSALPILLSLSCSAYAWCDPLDRGCNANEDAGHVHELGNDTNKAVRDAIEKGARDAGDAVKKGARDAGFTRDKGVVATGDGTRPLQPVRAYLRAKEIPPVGAGAYGLIVFHSKPTPANRPKLKMVCKSFVAFFPRNETSTVPLKDQMITVWPLDNPATKQAKKDDCDYAVDHYDLIASESAISDAQLQHAAFDGEGPYLVGWSPSKARGVPDALVLVVDMSADNSQVEIDNKFLFWKQKIVEDPSAWRNGFSSERIRVAIRIFADKYGQAMLDAIKLIGDKKP